MSESVVKKLRQEEEEEEASFPTKQELDHLAETWQHDKLVVRLKDKTAATAYKAAIARRESSDPTTDCTR